MKFNKRKSMLEAERNAILERMHETDPTDEMYGKLLNRFMSIDTMMSVKPVSPVSGDTMAIIGGTLAELIIVLAWEERHVIATKAFGMITKLHL